MAIRNDLSEGTTHLERDPHESHNSTPPMSDEIVDEPAPNEDIDGELLLVPIVDVNQTAGIGGMDILCRKESQLCGKEEEEDEAKTLPPGIGDGNEEAASTLAFKEEPIDNELVVKTGSISHAKKTAKRKRMSFRAFAKKWKSTSSRKEPAETSPQASIAPPSPFHQATASMKDRSHQESQKVPGVADTRIKSTQKPESTTSKELSTVKAASASILKPTCSNKNFTQVSLKDTPGPYSTVPKEIAVPSLPISDESIASEAESVMEQAFSVMSALLMESKKLPEIVKISENGQQVIALSRTQILEAAHTGRPDLVKSGDALNDNSEVALLAASDDSALPIRAPSATNEISTSKIFFDKPSEEVEKSQDGERISAEAKDSDAMTSQETDFGRLEPMNPVIRCQLSYSSSFEEKEVHKEGGVEILSTSSQEDAMVMAPNRTEAMPEPTLGAGHKEQMGTTAGVTVVDGFDNRVKDIKLDVPDTALTSNELDGNQDMKRLSFIGLMAEEFDIQRQEWAKNNLPKKENDAFEGYTQEESSPDARKDDTGTEAEVDPANDKGVEFPIATALEVRKESKDIIAEEDELLVTENLASKKSFRLFAKRIRKKTRSATCKHLSNKRDLLVSPPSDPRKNKSKTNSTHKKGISNEGYNKPENNQVLMKESKHSVKTLPQKQQKQIKAMLQPKMVISSRFWFNMRHASKQNTCGGGDATSLTLEDRSSTSTEVSGSLKGSDADSDGIATNIFVFAFDNGRLIEKETTNKISFFQLDSSKDEEGSEDWTTLRFDDDDLRGTTRTNAKEKPNKELDDKLLVQKEVREKKIKEQVHKILPSDFTEANVQNATETNSPSPFGKGNVFESCNGAQMATTALFIDNLDAKSHLMAAIDSVKAMGSCNGGEVDMDAGELDIQTGVSTLTSSARAIWDDTWKNFGVHVDESSVIGKVGYSACDDKWAVFGTESFEACGDQYMALNNEELLACVHTYSTMGSDGLVICADKCCGGSMKVTVREEDNVLVDASEDQCELDVYISDDENSIVASDEEDSLFASLDKIQLVAEEQPAKKQRRSEMDLFLRDLFPVM